MEQNFWYIKKADGLFSNLRDEELQLLAGMSRMVSCQRKHQFYLADESSDAIYYVKEGKVRLGQVTENGDEITFDVLGQGELFGELAVVDEQLRSHFAEALENSIVCIFPRDKFQSFLAKHQELTFRVMKLIGYRLREMESRLQDLTFQPVSKRLNKALLRLAEKHGVTEAEGRIRLAITQKDIALLVGATRESVAEELGQLKRSGLLETSYRSLLINDLDALRQQA